MGLSINLGCGPEYRDGWVNVEIDPACRADLRADLTDHATLTAAFQGQAVDCIYMKHVLEHLDMVQIGPQLAWCAQTLSKGGRLVIDGPDLRAMSFKLAMMPEWTWEDVAMVYGGQKSPWDYHRAGWSPEFLTQLLRRAGFVDVHMQRVDLCCIATAVRP